MAGRKMDPDRPNASTAKHPFEQRDVVVVSNREPYTHEIVDGERSVSRPAGGLTAALDPVMQSIGGTWVAWGSGEADRTVVDDRDHVGVPPAEQAYELRRVWLDAADLDGYYYGFSNQVLWPTFHGLPSKMHFEESFWKRYGTVNEQFAEAVVEEVDSPDPVVWFHDYHFGLAPALVREWLPRTALLAQFWHIPWPPWELFRRVPHRREVLEGVLSVDVFGVHTDHDRRHLVRCAIEELDAGYDPATGAITADGTDTFVRVSPVPVDVDSFDGALPANGSTTFWKTVSREYELGDRMVAVGVDRLDYTKGIVERLDALERLWETHPEYRGELTYVQKATESRSRIDAYREYQKAVETRIEAINDRFGTPSWQPIVYHDGMVTDAELGELYGNADVGVVTPIRDGMNLVAKEFVAAQDDDPGTLVLSETAGVAESLGEAAVVVNPLDTDTFVDGLIEAIEMPERERRRRCTWMDGMIRSRSSIDWIEALFHDAVDGSPESRPAATEQYAFVR